MKDNYERYTKNGEINYTGKVDSVKVFPGKDRIKFTYLLKSDPKISRVVIYWNTRMDSIVQPIQRTTGVDTITTIINNIPQGSYLFEFFTFDGGGHSSVKVTASGTVYGADYEALLNKRPVRSTELTAEGALIAWYGADPEMVGTEMVYTDMDDQQRTVLAPITDRETLMPDYKPGTPYKYRTLHQPEANMADTLYSSFTDGIVDRLDITADYLKNPGNPFVYDDYDGTRFGTLKDWTVTANVNNSGGYGSFDNIEGMASMSMAKFSDENASVSHGKIYQAVQLPPGTYSFTMYFDQTVSVESLAPPFSVTASAGSRVAAAAAAALPNTPGNTNSLAWATLSERTTVTFTLTKSPTTQVALGIWSTMTTNNMYFRASRVKLTKEI